MVNFRSLLQPVEEFYRENLGRFRVNIHHQRGTLAASIRLLPTRMHHDALADDVRQHVALARSAEYPACVADQERQRRVHARQLLARKRRVDESLGRSPNGRLRDRPSSADEMVVIVEDLIKLLDGISNGLRRDRYPDKATGHKVATVLRESGLEP